MVLLKQDAGYTQFEEEGGSLKAVSRASQGTSRPATPLRVGRASRWLPGEGAGAGLLAPG